MLMNYFNRGITIVNMLFNQQRIVNCSKKIHVRSEIFILSSIFTAHNKVSSIKYSI